MLLLGGLLSFSLCLMLIPAVIALAWRIGAIDVPRDWRRMHSNPIPRAGGLAIFFSFTASAIVFAGRFPYLISVLCGGGLLFALGLADDMFCLPAFFKLLFQFAAATASVFASGIVSENVAVWAILWVVVLTNAHNFIDGLDGLFAGCSAIEGSALCAAFLSRGEGDFAMPPLLLAGACLGFRCFNRHPAEIFAGDCGSGTVGFLLGMLSLPLFAEGESLFVSLSPLLMFAYPLTDLFTAVVRRVLRGKSPFSADRAHLHHRICAVGLNPPQCGGVLLLITVALNIVGVLLAAESYLFFTALACFASALLLIRLRHFITDCR
ncbi:MAG: undecaprenyl/decaprenyl-phosphate alpha-N-acetylglucosaminyl 1-phosphate transferase [Clostridia bacterium]|nr:undecaprenyl/decaprenyl-phosphate alpha-N-acetylglucosaminyl 1-phosphate transferase [Clostridia bacterium]